MKTVYKLSLLALFASTSMAQNINVNLYTNSHGVVYSSVSVVRRP